MVTRFADAYPIVNSLPVLCKSSCVARVFTETQPSKSYNERQSVTIGFPIDVFECKQTREIVIHTIQNLAD